MISLIISYFFLLLVVPSQVLASQSTVYELSPNQYHDNCFFITNLNHSFIDYKDPYISVHAMVKKLQNDKNEEITVDYDMNVILLNEHDISRTSIDSLNINHCTLDMIKEGKCKEEKVGLIDVEDNLKETVANVMLASNGANLLVYPIMESGWYCTFIKIHSSLSDEVSFPIRFEIQQSFGELTVHGYEEAETSILMFFFYVIVGICYKIYNFLSYKKLDLKDYNLLLKINKFVKIQNRLYKYCLINACLYLVTVIRYSIINITSYNHDYFSLALFHFVELSANTLFSVWIVYEILLFSDGFIVLNHKKNSLLNIITIRGLTILLFVSFIIFDLEESTVFSIQSYLGDFFKPFAEKNEFNLDVGSIGGWIIYGILTLIVFKIGANASSTIKLLKYKNPKLIKKFIFTILCILLTPLYMFLIAPFLSEIDLLGRSGSFLSSGWFIYTGLPYGNLLNFLNYIGICWIWRGADLAVDKDIDDDEEEEEEVIELNKL